MSTTRRRMEKIKKGKHEIQMRGGELRRPEAAGALRKILIKTEKGLGRGRKA